MSSSSYTIGRAKPTDVNLPLIDVNISRKHCEFSFDQESKTWSIQDFSSNGVSVNGIRIDKNSAVHLNSGDVVILSEQNDKYNWTFYLGDTKRKFQHCFSKYHNTPECQFCDWLCKRWCQVENKKPGFCNKPHHFALHYPKSHRKVVPMTASAKD